MFREGSHDHITANGASLAVFLFWFYSWLCNIKACFSADQFDDKNAMLNGSNRFLYLRSDDLFCFIFCKDDEIKRHLQLWKLRLLKGFLWDGEEKMDCEVPNGKFRHSRQKLVIWKALNRSAEDSLEKMSFCLCVANVAGEFANDVRMTLGVASTVKLVRRHRSTFTSAEQQDDGAQRPTVD